MAAADPDFDATLDEQVNRVLRKGSLIAAGLGFIGAVSVTVMILAGAATGLELAAVVALLCGLWCLVIHLLARANRMRGKVLYGALLPFVALPTVALAVTHVVLPGGAASYITGPYSYLYFILITLTAFTFDRRLPFVAGVVSGAGYGVMSVIALPELQKFHHPDPIVLQDLRLLPIFLMKGVMMVFQGALLSGLSAFSWRMLAQLNEASRRNEIVSRLFGEYVSAEVRDRLLGGNQQGERKRVAVLFSDVRGFSTFSEQHPPEVIVERLNAYFDDVTRPILRSGGMVDKFIGDAVMGVFGAFVDEQRPARAAFLAAMKMRGAVARMNQAWEARGWAPFENGIGLDVGEVVLGPIGSRRRKDFTVIGDTVNTASRAEGLCKTYGHPLVLTEGVFRELDPADQARCTPLGEVQVKGKQQPVRIYGVKDDALPDDLTDEPTNSGVHLRRVG